MPVRFFEKTKQKHVIRLDIRLGISRFVVSKLPIQELEEGEILQAFVPIYGTKDADCGLWRRVVRICTQEAGLKENFVFPAFYTHAVNGRIVLMLATHVDDFLWANEPEYDYLMDLIKQHLLLGKKEEISFRFTGKEFVQTIGGREPYTIKITCKATTEKLYEIDFPDKNKKQLDLQRECTTCEQQSSCRSQDR